MGVLGLTMNYWAVGGVDGSSMKTAISRVVPRTRGRWNCVDFCIGVRTVCFRFPFRDPSVPNWESLWPQRSSRRRRKWAKPLEIPSIIIQCWTFLGWRLMPPAAGSIRRNLMRIPGGSHPSWMEATEPFGSTYLAVEYPLGNPVHMGVV